MTTTVLVTALLVTGLMVGVELCVSAFLNPILDRLPGDVGLAGRADGGRILGRLMPFWYVAALALCLAAALVAPDAAGRWAAVVAAALLAVSVVMSVTLLVPINNRTKTWSPRTAPADWRDHVQRWDRLHVVRVAVIVAAFGSLAFASVAASSPPGRLGAPRDWWSLGDSNP